MLTCTQLGKHLHGVVESLLAEEVESKQVLNVVDLLPLITVGIIFHLLGINGHQSHDSTRNVRKQVS